MVDVLICYFMGCVVILSSSPQRMSIRFPASTGDKDNDGQFLNDMDHELMFAMMAVMGQESLRRMLHGSHPSGDTTNAGDQLYQFS